MHYDEFERVAIFRPHHPAKMAFITFIVASTIPFEIFCPPFLEFAILKMYFYLRNLKSYKNHTKGEWK